MRSVVESELDRALANVARADLLVVGEFGYVSVDVEGRGRPAGPYPTATRAGAWSPPPTSSSPGGGTVLGDEKLAVALVDRLCHHGRLVEFGGRSRRMENALMLGNSKEE